MKKRGLKRQVLPSFLLNQSKRSLPEIYCYSCGKVHRVALKHWGLTMHSLPLWQCTTKGRYLVELHSPRTGKVFQCRSCKAIQFVLAGKLLAAQAKRGDLNGKD